MGNTISHWVKTKTKMTERKYIEDGLAAMDIKFQTGDNLTIRGDHYNRNNREQVDIKINDYVGLRQSKDGSWDVVGDFYSTNLSKYYNRENKFMEDLQGKYCVAQAKDRIFSLPGGFTITDNEAGEVDEDGFIIMNAQSFVD